jgi:hypothetical protein
MNASKEIQHIIDDLIEAPEMIETDKIGCAFLLGSIVSRLEYVRQNLENYGNGDL